MDERSIEGDIVTFQDLHTNGVLLVIELAGLRPAALGLGKRQAVLILSDLLGGSHNTNNRKAITDRSIGRTHDLIKYELAEISGMLDWAGQFIKVGLITAK